MPSCLRDPFVATFSANFSVANATSYFQAAYTNGACSGTPIVNSQYSFCECVQRPLATNQYYRVQAYDRVQNPCGTPFNRPLCGASPLPACLAPSLLAPLALLLVLLALLL